MPAERQFQEQLARLQDDGNSGEYLTRSTEILEARKQEWKRAAIRWAQGG